MSSAYKKLNRTSLASDEKGIMLLHIAFFPKLWYNVNVETNFTKMEVDRLTDQSFKPSLRLCLLKPQSFPYAKPPQFP